MDSTCKKLDNSGAILNALSEHMARADMLPIPFIGVGGGKFSNPGAPHIELTFMMAGEIRHVRIGKTLTINLPIHHVSIHNVHFGNESKHYAGVKCICLFLDIGRDPALAWMGRRPFSHVFPVRNPLRLAEVFYRAIERCIAVSGSGGAYPLGAYGYDPDRDQTTGGAEQRLLQASTLEILGLAWQDAIRSPDAGIGAEEPLPMRLALDFMASHYADAGLRLEDVARAAHLSADHFGRLFRQRTGMSPMARLQALRIEHACRLLDQQSLRIHEVAEHVGFQDPFHFSRVFSQKTGVGPREYRAHRML